jgi:serine/threonine protein kinase
MVMRKVGKYEVGRTIGEGTFAKVKFAQNTETGESVAVKVLDKETVLKHKMVDQIKREISIMKLVRHPNVVRLHEVLASRTKIYIILEFITGGELFDKIVSFWTHCILQVFAPSLLLGLGYTLCCFAVSWFLFLAYAGTC